MVRLVDRAWDKEFDQALSADSSELRIICPFIKAGVIERLLSHQPERVQVITRFNLSDFAEGVSDLSALGSLRQAGATVRGVLNLHAKLYIFGTSRAIITSANLTKAALSHNLEFGLVAENAKVVRECRAYFDDLWESAGSNLTLEQANDWRLQICKHRLGGGRLSKVADLKDHGTDVGFVAPPSPRMPTAVFDAPQAFVKLLGKSDNRVPLDSPTFDELENGDCHWVVCYPTAKRPRSVKDDDIIFMGRLTRKPNDIRVFGRAIANEYKEGRDDATPSDIERRWWMKDWSRFIRVYHAEFLAGTMANGISLGEMMKELRADSFESTQLNAARAMGNTDPRRAYSQQPHVKLSSEGRSWLSKRLERAFEVHGKIAQDELNKLYRPAPDHSLN